MTRAMPKIALAALAFAGASCQPSTPYVAESGGPIVGRLQFQDRLVELTVESFADAPGAVPRGSFAEVMADIDVSDRREAAESNRESGLDRAR